MTLTNATYGFVSASTQLTSLPPNASANTKGAWTLLTASCQEIRGFWLHVRQLGQASARSYLVDIGIGAEGAEVAIISNLLISNYGAWGNAYYKVYFPYYIPAGTRITARSMCSIDSGGGYCYVAIVAHNYSGYSVVGIPGPSIVGGSRQLFNRCTAYGDVAASSRGTALTSGAAHTKGAFVALSESTANKIDGLILSLGAMSGDDLSVDIAVGAAGSESIIIPDLHWFGPTQNEAVGFGVIPVSIAAGTRLSARCQSTLAAQAVDIVALGLDRN